jgi:hypothetical protein
MKGIVVESIIQTDLQISDSPKKKKNPTKKTKHYWPNLKLLLISFSIFFTDQINKISWKKKKLKRLIWSHDKTIHPRTSLVHQGFRLSMGFGVLFFIFLFFDRKVLWPDIKVNIIFVFLIVFCFFFL